MRLNWIIPLCLALFMLSAACADTGTPPEPTAAATTAAASEPTEAPTVAPVAEAVTAVTLDPEAARATLSALLLESLTVSVPVTSGVGIDGAVAFPLDTTDGTVLWLAHTTGIRNFEPEQDHLMAIYHSVGDSWHEVARAEFTFNEDPDTPSVSPDYLGEGGITQVQVEPTHIWLAVEGGVGAHSGVFGLFSFDGSALTQYLGGFSSSPGVGQVVELSGDDINEVLVDNTDYYVFCYACGVRVPAYTIWYWDGTTMVPVARQPLSDNAPAEVRSFNDSLLMLANAGLWKDALALLDQAANFSYTEPAFQWNIIDVRVNATARRADVSAESAYPLLSQVFFGDYDAAVEIMRTVGAEGLFHPETALIVGTAAEGWQAELADRLTANAGAV
ncbi:MAG: hypothetical protein KDE31_38725, partial [Caldilineaceae bacterium]|nr:hypothetical protein [Caldilineaceae bacterium]